MAVFTSINFYRVIRFLDNSAPELTDICKRGNRPDMAPIDLALEELRSLNPGRKVKII